MADGTTNGASWDWIWKVVVWGAPLMFTAGGAWWQLTELRADLARVEARAEAVGEALRAHEQQPGHVDSQARLGMLEQSQAEMLVEQRRASENLAAICQVTGGAL